MTAKDRIDRIPPDAEAQGDGGERADKGGSDRQARQARALRANLRKRKAQQRARAGASTSPDPGSPEPERSE